MNEMKIWNGLFTDWALNFMITMTLIEHKNVSAWIYVMSNYYYNRLMVNDYYFSHFVNISIRTPSVKIKLGMKIEMWNGFNHGLSAKLYWLWLNINAWIYIFIYIHIYIHIYSYIFIYMYEYIYSYIGLYFNIYI